MRRRCGARGPARRATRRVGAAPRPPRTRTARVVDKAAKIFGAGARGLAGSAIVRALRAAGFQNLLLPTSSELDLTEGALVRSFFEKERPHYVFDAAAKVGGIVANNTLPAEFIHSNPAIQTNLIDEAWPGAEERV